MRIAQSLTGCPTGKAKFFGIPAVLPASLETRRDWTTAAEGEGRDFLRFATQVKNIWIPYGE